MGIEYIHDGGHRNAIVFSGRRESRGRFSERIEDRIDHIFGYLLRSTDDEGIMLVISLPALGADIPAMVQVQLTVFSGQGSVFDPLVGIGMDPWGQTATVWTGRTQIGQGESVNDSGQTACLFITQVIGIHPCRRDAYGVQK